MEFKAHLTIREIKNLPMNRPEGMLLMVRIQWIGSRRRYGFTGQERLQWSCTSKQPVQAGCAVRWDEGFEHSGRLRRKNSSESCRSWNIGLEVVQVFDQNSEAELPIAPKAKIDVAEYLQADATSRTIRIPLDCDIKDSRASSIAVLEVKLRILELRPAGSNVSALTRSLSSRLLPCIGFVYSHPEIKNVRNGCRNASRIASVGDSTSDDEQEFDYNKLQMAKMLLIDQFASVSEDAKNTREIVSVRTPPPSVSEKKKKPSLVRFLSWNLSRLIFKLGSSQLKGVPLLNKQCSDIGGDDIDIERHQESSMHWLGHSHRSKVHPTGFEDDDRFEVGTWEKKRVLSRDGELELGTDAFLASIDQRSETAAGGSACTVLAVVVAHWLHQNPNAMPLRCQLDELVREGSAEWRRLCADARHAGSFPDHHFDLDTVLRAKVRPLREVVDMSYIGFFGLDANAMASSLEFLQGLRSFESIWSELMQQEKVYIASWNDHFFVLKIEREAIYLIDTLGERLFEGCNQAYILRFDKESVIYRHICREADEESQVKEMVCRGLECCREYIKGFLAAVPLKQLQEDIENGVGGGGAPHRRLQIEFHYVHPCDTNTCRLV